MKNTYAKNTTQPTIKRFRIAGVEGFELYSPDGELAATFYNEHFLRRIMEEMFDFSPFAPLLIGHENQNACPACCHTSECPHDAEVQQSVVATA